MWREIYEFLAENWAEWVFMIITGAVGFGYRRVRKHQKEDTKRNSALSDGVQALLRDRIIGGYNEYSEKGYCPIYGRENLERAYSAYHNLGGNDVATGLYHEIMDLPTERRE